LFQTLNAEQQITIILVTHEFDIAAHAKRQIHFKDGLVLSDKGGDPVACRAES
jgi:putative ABC transport system ATP-binding protein